MSFPGKDTHFSLNKLKQSFGDLQQERRKKKGSLGIWGRFNTPKPPRASFVDYFGAVTQQQECPWAEGSLCQQAQPQPRVLPGDSSGWELAPAAPSAWAGCPPHPAHGARLPHCWNALSCSLPEKKHLRAEILVQNTAGKVLELYVLKQVSAPSKKISCNNWILYSLSFGWILV